VTSFFKVHFCDQNLKCIKERNNIVKLYNRVEGSNKVIHFRPMKNEWGATLAGDLAQTALLKRRSQTYIGPDGWFNTSLCARGKVSQLSLLVIIFI
jgi:hypothetical protein